MKKTLLACVLFLASTALGAEAPVPTPESTRAEIQKTFGFLPTQFKVLSPSALPGAWEEMKGIQLNSKTALSGKVKELIGLAVAAQIPCAVCVGAHTKLAKMNGASDVEIAEAVTLSAITRHWSTFIDGMRVNDLRHELDVAKAIETEKKSPPAPEAEPARVTNQETALKDISQTYGLMPDFLRQFPQEGIVGAWRELRDFQMSSRTALPRKHKSLIALAVSAQVPCRGCATGDVAFGKAAGASERELREAVAMAALVRHWSTVVIGMQVPEATLRSEWDRMAKTISKMEGVTSTATGSSLP